ncbi:unnamed protein product [Urochloa decumbens]|uniref:Uncharacterized protein n=1 Tax=Urochloa decumbens TaxID=240449 RepID=A0ABC9EGY0_9POAL
MRITTQQPGPGPVVVCLQAQHVAGLPAVAEGRQVLLRLTTAYSSSAAAAVSVCRGGVAAFHDQVLLLDLVDCSGSSMVAVDVTVGDTADTTAAAAYTTVVDVHLAEEQLRRPSPNVNVLTFVLGGTRTTAGAVLSLALHHRLLVVTRRRCSCMMMLMCCLCLPPPPAAHHSEESSEDSSSGFITIEKGTIHISAGGRRPPSDNLLTTDDDEDDDDRKVEDEFLAMLGHADDLDAVTKDATPM